MLYLLVFQVVRAHVPRMTLDELFEQKGDVANAVLEELEKVSLCCSDGYRIVSVYKLFVESNLDCLIRGVNCQYYRCERGFLF